MTNQELNSSGKGSFVFYESFYEGLEELDPETRLEFFEAIAKFGLYGIEPEYKGWKAAYWKQIKACICSAQKRYKASVENGRKGGAPVGNQNARKQPKSTQNNLEQPKSTENNLNDNVNDNVNENDNINDNENVNDNLSPTFDIKPKDLTYSGRDRVDKINLYDNFDIVSEVFDKAL